MSKKILTLTEQRHIWSTLSETFVGLTQQEKYDIIKALGLDGLIDEDGSYIPFYSMDIHSSRPTYITNQFDTKLTANLFNYTENISSDVTKWKWERISGNPTEDENWAVGKNTRELNITFADFTERFTAEQDITFKVSATIKGKTVTDEIVFSKILYFSKVQIVSDKNVFIESTPEKIRLSFTTDIAVNSVRWYIDNRFLSASETFELGYNSVPLGGSATIKLEVEEEVTGKVFTDSLTIPRLSVGKDGEPGVKCPPGTSSYTWIKYADGPNGEGMDEYPFKLDGTAREYIGMAVGKDSPTESNNPADYVWTKYIGDQGIPGETGESVFSSIVFKRSASAPTTPTGGTYFKPIPEGWSDGIPEESNGNPVWMSTRVFTLSGNSPQDPTWSTPQITSDTATLDIDWSSSDVENPGTPDTPLNGAVWNETSSTDSIWMAIQRTVNGEKKPWEVWKIKGERGINGEDGATTKSVFAFKRSHTKPAAATGGTFENPVPEGASDGIPPENGGMPVWMTSGKVTDIQVTPIIWSDWIIVSDTATVNFDWSDYEGEDLEYLGNPDTKPNLWYKESSPNSVYMAIQQTLNGEKQPWVIKRVKGEKGEDGKGISIKSVFAFKRSHTKPETPTGGTYDIPVPNGWFDGIPPESNGMPVWMVSGKVTSDQATPIIWSEPVNTSDTATMDIDWSDYAGYDLNVLGNPDTRPAMWNEESSVTNTYMAIQLTLNGQKQPWEVKKIRGEDGVDGKDGKNGQSIVTSFVFKRSSTKPARPSGGSLQLPVPPGWSDGIPTELDGMPLWMSSRIMTSDALAPQTDWTEPVLATDTANIDFEWTDSTANNPGTPSVPLNGAVWTNQSSVNSVWMAVRKIENGTPREWKVSKIKGEKGNNSFTASVFIRSETQPNTPTGGTYFSHIPSGWSDGIPEANGKPAWISTRIFSSDGLAPQQSTWSTPSLVADTSSIDYEFSSFLGENPGNPSFPLNGAVWTNQSSVDTVWMAVAEISNGVRGEWKVTKIKGEKGINGRSILTSFVFKRSPDNSVITTKPTGGTFENPIPSGWSDGIPSGVGALYQSVRKFTSDGLAPQEAEWSTPTLAQDTQYKDYAYSNSLTTPVAPPNTQTPLQDNAVWHNDPHTDDIWQAVRTVQNHVYGPWTIQRIKGEKGEPSYMWIKFSLYSNGRNPSGNVEMYDTPFIIKSNGERENMVYLGIAYNKQDINESNNPDDYTWSKIKGEDGRTPFTLDLSNDNVSVPANSSGTTGSTAFNLAKTDIKLYYGNDVIDPSEYTLSFTPTNVTYVLSNNNHHLQITGMTGTTGEVRIEAKAKANNKLLATATFSIVKVVGTATYEILPSTSVIKIVNNYTGGDQKVQPTSIDVKIKKNTGESVDTVNEGRLTYRYIYASTVGTDDDGVNLPIDQILNIDNSGDPLFLEFKYFHPVTNAMVDRETIPFVRDGVSANTTELRFRVTNTSTIIPSLDKSNPNPPDWTVTQPTVPTGHVLWMTRAVKKANGDLIGQWSDPIIFIGMPGADGPQGPRGMSGTTGPSPRTFEWLPGAQYQVGEGFIDYAYYRGTGVGDPCLGWYVVKLDSGKTIADYNTTAKKVIANATGCPDSNLFVKAPFSGDMTFSTIIAEQANLAGFNFRNQILQSQKESYQSCTTLNDRGPYPNLTINGFRGIIKFLERMVLDRDGITLNDDCGKPRMVFQWNNTTGIPVLKFLNENGETTWEAGKSGYVIITQGTTQPSWTNKLGFRRIQNLPMIESISFGDASNGYQAGNENAMIVRALTDSLIVQEDPATNPNIPSRTHEETKPVWFVQNAMPNGHQYTTDHSNNFFDNTGFAEFYNKGDIAANSKHYEGYYITRNPIEIGQEVGNPNLIPDGWYLIEGISGANAAQLMSSLDLLNPNLEIFGTNVVYMKNGNISNTVWVPLYKYYSS